MHESMSNRVTWAQMSRLLSWPSDIRQVSNNVSDRWRHNPTLQQGMSSPKSSPHGTMKCRRLQGEKSSDMECRNLKNIFLEARTWSFVIIFCFICFVLFIVISWSVPQVVIGQWRRENICGILITPVFFVQCTFIWENMFLHSIKQCL